LTDINIDLPYGKKLGIMGKTGSGKSSLLKLMSRFYKVTKGSVFINGVDIRKIKLEDVRLQFGYVMQDVFLFSNTIDANIAFFDPEVSHEEVVKAARVAQAHDFITAMPQGYETIVGERGVGLSGGQKQRVSIARALLKNAPILLLDDATSALDWRPKEIY
jgi:ABC-type multidrug transport system fused ATPase/permease subunit